MNLIFLIHLLATAYMVGVIWLVQLTHYPLMSYVERSRFAAFERKHVESISWVVIPGMLLEAATLGLLLVSGYDLFMVVSSVLLIFIWGVTFFVSSPCHRILLNGYDQTVHERLVKTNLLRAVAWSLRLLLIAVVFMRSGDSFRWI